MMLLMFTVASTYAIRVQRQADLLTQQNMELTASQSQVARKDSVLSKMLLRLDAAVGEGENVPRNVLLDAAILSGTLSQDP